MAGVKKYKKREKHEKVREAQSKMDKTKSTQILRYNFQFTPTVKRRRDETLQSVK